MLRRPRLTYANVTATLALFVALGGTSWAVTQLPKDSVGKGQLKTGAVTTNKLARGAVTADKLAAGVAVSGPRGPRGPQGPAGAGGADGATDSSWEPWRPLPLAPGWAALGTDQPAPEYRRDAQGNAQLRGTIRPTTGTTAKVTDSLIGTIPAGSRPKYREIFNVRSSPDAGGVAHVDVLPDGSVVWRDGTANPPVLTSLNGIFYSRI
ncbi:MAG: hypothetical protein PGN13_00080 [Patulibacter minatonensis]